MATRLLVLCTEGTAAGKPLLGGRERVVPRCLGVLAFVHPSRTRPFGEQTGYIRSLLAMAQQLELEAYAFGPDDVDRSGRRVRAYLPARSGWRRRWCPAPTLVYDRFFLHQPWASVLRRYRQLKREARWAFLNPQLPNKWKVYCDLYGEPSVRPLLPPTRLYRGATRLLAGLKPGAEVVVKPAAGMKGAGLWFVRRRGDAVVVAAGEGVRRRMSEAAFRSWAAGRLGRRHIVQPALAFCDERGRPFDIRVLLQREGEGGLLVTGLGVRVGRPGRRVANLHRGGRALTLSAAVGHLPGLRASLERAGIAPAGADDEAVAAAWRRHLETAALAIGTVLERCYGTFAELGLDFGYDRQRGRLYFIEANSRPGRALLRLIGDGAARSLAIRRPLLYARERLRWMVAGGARMGAL